MGAFTHGFADCANVTLPHQRMIFHPITFGLVVPNITANIMRDRAHLEHVTRAEQFSGLEILRMHNQHDF